MKMNKLITTAAVALSVLGVVSTSASAATITAGATDLILGFQATTVGSTGYNTNLEIDLGPITNFTSTTATTVLSGLSGLDLSAIYGAGWATRTDLTFAVAGTATTVNTGALYITANSGATPVEVTSNAEGFGYIKQLATGINGATSTVNSATAAAIGNSGTPANTIGNSYVSLVTEIANGSYASDFGFQRLNPGDAQSLSSTGSLELYSFARAAGSPSATDVGSFSLSSAGVLTFTGAAAVPEPSTYLLGLFGLVALLALRRRNAVL